MDEYKNEIRVNTKTPEFRQMFAKIYCLRYEWPDIFKLLKNYEYYLKMFQMVEENVGTPMFSSSWNECKERHLRDPLFGQELALIYQDKRLLEFLAHPPFFKDINLLDQDKKDDMILRLCIYWTGITGNITGKTTTLTQTPQPTIYPSAASQRLEYDDFDLVVESNTNQVRDVTSVSPSEVNINMVRAVALNGDMQVSVEFKKQEILDLWLELQHSLLSGSSNIEKTNEIGKILGKRLFSALFPGEVEVLFRTALNNSRAKAHGLRIHLRLESYLLYELPWEYAYDEAEDQYLAITPELPLSRYLRVSSFVRDLRIKPPIKILFIASTPKDLLPLDVISEQNLISEALANLTASGLVRFDIISTGTLANLRQRLRETYHIVHFSGHGGYREDRLGLVFMNEDGTSRFVSDDELQELFLGNRTVRLLVLSACARAPERRKESDRAFLGIAPKLVHRSIPSILVMQSDITDLAAKIFSRELYQSLATNFALDVAVAEARRGIRLDIPNELIWGIPIIYMQSRDGRIFDIDEAFIRPFDLSTSKVLDKQSSLVAERDEEIKRGCW